MLTVNIKTLKITSSAVYIHSYVATVVDKKVNIL